MYLKKISLKKLIFFSSSEVYGNPDKKNIPTKEDYDGNVSFTGPRACYDESKDLEKHWFLIIQIYINLNQL